MNIHEAAKILISLEELPVIYKPDSIKSFGYSHGLCSALAQVGATSVYTEMTDFMEEYTTYLPERGVYTDQRLNIICLLSITTPEDFV